MGSLSTSTALERMLTDSELFKPQQLHDTKKTWRAPFSTSQRRRDNPTANPSVASTDAEKGSRLLTLETTDADAGEPRLPRTVQALHLRPLRRECEFGVPTADLQIRSYQVRTLEFFCDFALRAAYYLDLAAFGPVPLPKITERWTVPRSSFIFKKSQENFERITRRRLIQIRDGHPEAVQVWLAFLRKHAIAGVGMKANVWEFGSLGASCFHVRLGPN